MPKYYHVHRSFKPSQIEIKLIEDHPLYFSKKNSFWYHVEIDISKDKDVFDGYTIYEITIPRSQFTESLNPRKKNKIFKVTKKNLDEFIKLKKKYEGSFNLIKEMKKRNFIGYDATLKIKNIKKWHIIGTGEGVIWDFSKFKPRIRIYDIHKN